MPVAGPGGAPVGLAGPVRGVVLPPEPFDGHCTRMLNTGPTQSIR
jgi:hypothetical protein